MRAAAHHAGQVVGEIQIGDGAAHRGRPGARNGIQLMARALEEQIRLSGSFQSRKLKIQLVGLRGGQPRIGAHGLLQAEARLRLAPVLLREEKCQVLDGERLQQPVAHRGQHGVQIRLRAQFAREFHQGAAVIVAVAVEVRSSRS